MCWSVILIIFKSDNPFCSKRLKVHFSRKKQFKQVQVSLLWTFCGSLFELGLKKYLNSSLSFGKAALIFFLPVSTSHLSYNKLVNDFVRGCLTFRSYLPSKKIDSFRLLDGAFCEPWKTECARCMLELHMRSNKPPWLLILTGQCRKLNFNIKLTNGPKRIVYMFTIIMVFARKLWWAAVNMAVVNR